MKSFLQRKMEEEGCDALELAAAMLKYQVGDKGEEIAADEYAQRRGRFGERGRFGRGGDEGRNFGRRGGRRRDNGRDDEEHRERRRFGRGDGAGREDSRDGENSRFGRSDRKRSGRDKKTAERKLTGDCEERERKKRKKKEEPGIGNSFPKRK